MTEIMVMVMDTDTRTLDHQWSTTRRTTVSVTRLAFTTFSHQQQTPISETETLRWNFTVESGIMELEGRRTRTQSRQADTAHEATTGQQEPEGCQCASCSATLQLPAESLPTTALLQIAGDTNRAECDLDSD